MNRFFLLIVALILIAAAGCNSDSGGSDNSGLLTDRWEGFQVSTTNGIFVTRDLVMKLSHDSNNNVTGTKQLGNSTKQTVKGEFFPASSVLDLTVTDSGVKFEETWRLEQGGMTLTLVSGGSAQVSRTN
jgi:hypothetical protein